jgi:hypothetical protein
MAEITEHGNIVKGILTLLISQVAPLTSKYMRARNAALRVALLCFANCRRRQCQLFHRAPPSQFHACLLRTYTGCLLVKIQIMRGLIQCFLGMYGFTGS